MRFFSKEFFWTIYIIRDIMYLSVSITYFMSLTISRDTRCVESINFKFLQVRLQTVLS